MKRRRSKIVTIREARTRRILTTSAWKDMQWLVMLRRLTPKGYVRHFRSAATYVEARAIRDRELAASPVWHDAWILEKGDTR